MKKIISSLSPKKGEKRKLALRSEAGSGQCVEHESSGEPVDVSYPPDEPQQQPGAVMEPRAAASQVTSSCQADTTLHAAAEQGQQQASELADALLLQAGDEFTNTQTVSDSLQSSIAPHPPTQQPSHGHPPTPRQQPTEEDEQQEQGHDAHAQQQQLFGYQQHKALMQQELQQLRNSLSSPSTASSPPHNQQEGEQLGEGQQQEPPPADVAAGQSCEQAMDSPSSVFLALPGTASVTSSLQLQPPASKLTYRALQLRCQALEVALEQAAQRAEAASQAVAAAHAAHATQEESMRQYFEAQLSDRQAELRLLMQHMAAAQEAASAADGGGSTVVIGAEDSLLGAASVEAHQASPCPQSLSAGAATATARPLSPTVMAVVAGAAGSMRQSRQQQQQQQQQDQQQQGAAGPGVGGAGTGSTAGGGTGSVSILSGGVGGTGSIGMSSSVSLTDVALLRRELGQAELLLRGYQEENKAAARRIKDLESQLSLVRAELADEAGRAQRAAAAAAETQRASGAAAAERLARQLQLEGQLEALQASWHEREGQLMSQLDMLRRDKAAAEARAAAAAEGHDMARWEADDALVAELRQQLSAQAAAHASQLDALRDKLNWYVENQALLGGADELVARQAAVIRELEGRLMEAEGAAGKAQAARIAELEQQAQQLKEALCARHPSSVPALLAAAKPGPAEAAALAAAAATIQQLQGQLQLQAQQHKHSLRQLQQQYETLQARLAQSEGTTQQAPAKARVRELSQQLEEQRAMYTRRIRALEARLTAAEGAAAAAAASRRSSSSNIPGAGRPGGARVGLRAAGTAGTAAAGSSRRSTRAAAGDGSDGAAGLDSDSDKQAVGPAEAADEAAGPGPSGGGVPAGRPAVVSGLLRLKERQMAGLMAQLEERTSQFLALQQKYRAAERELKAVAAREQHADGDNSCSSSSPTASSSARRAKQKAKNSTAAAAAGAAAGQRDVSAPPDVSPRVLPSAVGAGNKSPQLGTGGSAAHQGGGATSWPALCAELEAENDTLKAQLLELRQALAAGEQEVSGLTDRLAGSTANQNQHPDSHQPCNQQQLLEMKPAAASGAASGVPGVGLLLPSSISSLLSVAEEAAGREAARWRERVALLEQALHAAQADAAAAHHELALARGSGGWTPGLAAFEALERKINTLEAAAAAQQQQAAMQQPGGLLAGLVPATAAGGLLLQVPGSSSVMDARVAALAQQFEAALAAKNAELEGFRVQVDALLEAANQLQQQRLAAVVGTGSPDRQQQ